MRAKTTTGPYQKAGDLAPIEAKRWYETMAFEAKEYDVYNDADVWNTEEKVKITQKSDKIKNRWCKNNNIPLIRIPYTHKEITLNDLLLETTTFLINGKE